MDPYAILLLLVAPLIQHVKKLLKLEGSKVLLLVAIISVLAAGVYLYLTGALPVLSWPPTHAQLESLFLAAQTVMLTAMLIYLAVLKKIDGTEVPPNIFEPAQDLLIQVAAIFGIELRKPAATPPAAPNAPPPPASA